MEGVQCLLVHMIDALLFVCPFGRLQLDELAVVHAEAWPIALACPLRIADYSSSSSDFYYGVSRLGCCFPVLLVQAMTSTDNKVSTNQPSHSGMKNFPLKRSTPSSLPQHWFVISIVDTPCLPASR